MIGEVAAKSGNAKVFKWATYDGWNSSDLLMQYDVFLQVAENGHIKVLEWAAIKDLDWYHPKMLFDAAARTNLELLHFILKRKPKEFNLNFLKIELFTEALYSEQRGMLDNLYNNEYQQAPSYLKEN